MQRRGISSKLILINLIAGIILLPIQTAIPAETSRVPLGAEPTTGDFTKSQSSTTQINIGTNEEHILLNGSTTSQRKTRKGVSPAGLCTFIGILLLIRFLNMAIFWLLLNRYEEDEPAKTADVPLPTTTPPKLLQ